MALVEQKISSDSEWRLEQLKELFGSAPIALVAGYAVALILAAAQWDAAGPGNCLVFLALLGVVTAGRLLLIIGFRRVSPVTTDGSWLTWFRFGALCAGLSWAVGVYLLFPAGDAVHQVFVAMAIAGVCAGAVASLAVDIVSLLALVLLPLAMLIALFVIEGGAVPMSMAGMILLFLVLVSLTGRRFQRWMRELTGLRIDAVARARQRVQVNALWA